MRIVLLFGIFLVNSVKAVPISQPVVPNPYVNAQQVQAIQFVPRLRPQPQIQYAQQQQPLQESDVSQIYGGLPHRQSSPAPPPPPPPSPPAQIQQLLLPSAVDQQVQQAAAYVAGPHYAQQVQNIQLQGLANQAQDIAQRRAQLTALRLKQLQPQALQQQTQAKVFNSQPPIQDSQTQEDYDPNPSYQFGFDVKDDYHTNYQNRKEQRDGNKITGSYSVVDADGFLRTVTYTADPKEGFKAEVNRQPTNIVVKFPKPLLPEAKQQYLQQDDPQLGGQKQRLIYQQYQE
ncbi:hypothetical protein RI129_008331 [Pyrocoelia pectoralis]|uniref:Uncharacterized protein n=1 Tax=Pyrocoelia pectoralis TaxID=417401 RepID=A0AAN7VDY4_9COLE